MTELDSTGARVLDAAVQVLVDFGFKRATVELIAKYAGVSRTTVRRRWPSSDELLQAAVLREFTTVFDTAVRDLDDRGTFDDKVVRAFTAVVWSLRNHVLMTRELKTEPETVLPFLTTASAPAMQAALAFVAQRLRRSAQASGVNLTDPEALADILVRLAHSVLLVPHPDRPLTTRIDIEDYARRYIRPVTRYVSSGVPGARPKPRRSPVGLLSAAAVTALVGTAAATSWVAYAGWPNIAPLDSVKSTTRPTTQPSVTSEPPPMPVFTAPTPPATPTTAPAPQVVWSPPAPSRPFTPSTRSVTVAAPTTPSQDSDPRRGPLDSSGGMAPPMMPPMGPVPRLGTLPGTHSSPPKAPSQSPSVSTGSTPKVVSSAKSHAGRTR